MNIKEFEKSDVFTFEAKCTLWNKENIGFGVDFPDERKGENLEILSKHLSDIEKQLKWIEENRRCIEKTLLDDDMVSLAEDWASSSEEAEDEEQECYLMEDDQKVFLPISDEDFCKSLYIDGFSINFEDGWDKPNIDLYLCCSPDYFAYHCISISIDENKSVECNNLAG
ncbi:DUF2262 domain-containing protein [Clostridium botulinum]|uniref:DUF2262 domain-containing protein n=1 Tax=Clostridium botulinum (strain Eklund 17B / Type B) TaxID=935198 RepID=B2TRE7_CLOBB|nr:DUF2262 domain-containing protein [Clostridium sp. VAP51]ACD23046.1 conserved hypothetical protein [Clostridium botulinum B str. Eklund 17B (NRP)]MBY6976884.1 DUF2262 domain-containing protein [Clostridium botulinum]MBY7002063.1 DUF2262 domain-containing protein [Clostridium botulinum]MCR1272883.1 DUF2262 domain-containing protein [Clostridium botulinum]NFD69756.1 DUF2262 domain-containing protein [Clostridium botulinum]